MTTIIESKGMTISYELHRERKKLIALTDINLKVETIDQYFRSLNLIARQRQ